MFNKRFLMSVMVATIMCFSLTGCGAEIVEPGHSGIKKTLGKVEPDPLPPGFYLYNPMISTVFEVDNRVQRLENTTEVYTKDVQQVDVTYVINYNLQPAKTVEIYTEVGKDYADILIPQAIEGIMKNTIGKWNAIELVSNRGQASAGVSDAINVELEKHGIKVSGFQMTNLKFRQEFEAAVEAKVNAVQKAEEARNNTVQVEEQAKQRVIAAEADAKAMQIQTAALKESQSLVLYEAVKKWNGVLPSIVTGEGSNMLMQLPTK